MVVQIYTGTLAANKQCPVSPRPSEPPTARGLKARSPRSTLAHVSKCVEECCLGEREGETTSGAEGGGGACLGRGLPALARACIGESGMESEIPRTTLIFISLRLHFICIPGKN